MLPSIVRFLVYLYQATAPNRDLRVFLLDGDGTFSESTIEYALSQRSSLVTYDVSTLIDLSPEPWRSKLSEVIDIDVALTLRTERSRRETDSSATYSFLQVLKTDPHTTTEAFLKHCFRGEPLADEGGMADSAKSVAIKLRDTWLESCSDLAIAGGLDRLTNCEISVAQVVYHRQAVGLAIDQENLIKNLNEIDRQLSDAKRQLRNNFGITDPRDTHQVQNKFARDSALRGIDLVTESEWGLRSLLDIYSGTSDLAKLYKTYKKMTTSKAVLLRFGAIGEDRIHPDSVIMGTVTDRIMIRNPALQNLAREFRDVIKSDPGMTLLYPDFKQCEPGILAHECADAKLINDYNAGDLYLALSEAVFKDSAHRGEAKLLFLFVCYGMTHDRLCKIGSEITGMTEQAVGSIMDEFFENYPGIE
jgi:hypothetical protein